MPTLKLSSPKASALLTVVMLIAMMAILTASMLNYTLSERRGNERNRLILRAKNMAENVTLYSAEQISIKLHRMKTVSLMQFASGANQIYLPPDNVLTTSYSSPTDVETYAGITANTGLIAQTTDPTSSNYGLQVLTGTVPIIAKSRMSHPALGAVTSYCEQDMQISEVPLFQFAIFYDKDLEFSPGADMVISGPVHSNGDFIARDQTGFTNTVQFKDRVSAVGAFFANSAYKGTTYNEMDGADTGPGGTGPLLFQPPSTAAVPNPTPVDIKSSAGVWRDHKYGGSTVTTTSETNFRTFATSSYGTNFRTSAHKVSEMKLPGLNGTSNNSGRSVIEAPDSSDSTDLITAGTQFSRKAGLYIIVNPDDEVRTGKLPDADTVTMLPHSYRCWLNTINSDSTHTIREVVLPGQPTYGYNNNGTPTDYSDDYMYRNYLPNRYTTSTSVGSNQVLRIPQQDFYEASGYQLNGARAINDTALPLKTGTGTIRAGETITIGSYKYLVTADLAGGSVTIASPGLRAAAADSATVTVNSPYAPVGTGTGYLSNTAATYAIGTTALTIDTGSGTILPGNTITIGSYKYLVTCAATAAPLTSVWIAPPGLRATVANNVAITLDSTSCTLGSGTNYLVNNATGYPAATTTLTLDTGAGTILPGNALYIGGNRYLVASATTATPLTSVSIIPGLSAAVADNDPVMIDPFPYTGYTTGPAVPLTQSVTTIHAAYFYDLRRVTNSNGHPFSRTTDTFLPRPIAKIDFDMARFKMCVNRTLSGTAATLLATDTSTTGYNVDVPNSTNWANNILKSDATTATLHHGLGGSYNTYPATTDAITRCRQDPFRIYYAPTYAPSLPPAGYATAEAALADDPSVYAVGSATFDGPWFDGVTVYIHSAGAETLSESSAGVRNRIDSAVRLWNGRGPVITLTAAGSTGCSICTNDPIYIVGHYNADGIINATSTSTTAYGGYSARYPDSADEKLAAVMGDAITIYSQPVFTNSGTNYYQSSGWSDSLSGNCCRTTSWSSSWATTNPGSSNRVDGTNASNRPASMPNLGTDSPGTGTAVAVKFNPTVTEVSACLLAGIVETNIHQNSGGVHNYPRLNENWNGTGLYIRGSMIAMFASEIATEPWSIRIYSGAGRYWGLHQNLRDANHEVPLEPMLITASRLAFKELTAAEYATMKTTILALP
jgi:hypothetical protein